MLSNPQGGGRGCNAPSSSIAANAGRVAVMGADGMVYLIGGMNSALTASTEVYMFDVVVAGRLLVTVFVAMDRKMKRHQRLVLAPSATLGSAAVGPG